MHSSICFENVFLSNKALTTGSSCLHSPSNSCKSPFSLTKVLPPLMAAAVKNSKISNFSMDWRTSTRVPTIETQNQKFSTNFAPLQKNKTNPCFLFKKMFLTRGSSYLSGNKRICRLAHTQVFLLLITKQGITATSFLTAICSSQ